MDHLHNFRNDYEWDAGYLFECSVNLETSIINIALVSFIFIPKLSNRESYFSELYAVENEGKKVAVVTTRTLKPCVRTYVRIFVRNLSNDDIKIRVSKEKSIRRGERSFVA